jgi:hypothetical protein
MIKKRLDPLLDYALTKEGRENLALALIAAGCITGIVTIGRI